MIKLGVILISIFTLFSQGNNAQMVLNQKGIEDISKLSFNVEVLKAKGIKSITTSTRLKKELQPIVNVPSVETQYSFDQEGYINQYYKVYKLTDYLLDTVVEYYTYTNNQLTTLIKSEYGRFGRYVYEYKNNRLSKEIRYREENTTGNKLDFIPAEQTKISEQTYTYEDANENLYIQCARSVENICFREEEVYSEKGNVVKQKIRFIFDDTQRESIFYAYKNGKLTSKSYKDEYKNKFEKKMSYQYNNKGEIYSITYFDENNKLLKTIEFLYKDELLDATLEKNEDTGTITIVKYKYEYY